MPETGRTMQASRTSKVQSERVRRGTVAREKDSSGVCTR